MDTITSPTQTNSVPIDATEDISNQSYVRKRTRATADQLSVLEDTFAVNVSPNSKLRKQLSDQLNMSERSIQIWFQNRRAKVKHMQKRAQMQMQQAAIRAQLYHYQQHQQQQQQQYNMLPYGTVMSVPPFYNQHYVPHYARRVQLPPRAQSVDSLSFYNPPSSDLLMTRSAFPTPGPEPFMTAENTTSPSYFDSTIPNSGNSWSVSPGFQNKSPLKMYRQSFSVQSLSHHRLSEDNILSDLGSSSNDSFPDYIHGQISPSPSPNREDFDISNPNYFGTDNDNNLSSSSSSVTFLADGVSQDNQNKYLADGSSTKWNKDTSLNNFETLDTPVRTRHNSLSDVAQESVVATVNPTNLIIGDSSSVSTDNNSCLSATTLTIGSWHRLKLHSTDLLCEYKSIEKCFVWHIIESGCRFKVEIPLSSVLNIEHISRDNLSDANFFLSQPPLFYMETLQKDWIQCSDFTENKQGSRSLRHTLKGVLRQELTQMKNKNEELSKLIHFVESNPVSFLPSQPAPIIHSSHPAYYPYHLTNPIMNDAIIVDGFYS